MCVREREREIIGWLIVLFNGVSTRNAELNHFDKSFKLFSLALVYFCLQTITCQNSSISNNSV